MISELKLKDAERIVRFTMILILLTAGTSKFFSHGGFFEHYSQLFQGNLRINLAPLLCPGDDVPGRTEYLCAADNEGSSFRAPHRPARAKSRPHPEKFQRED
jgi:hypothetical protein